MRVDGREIRIEGGNVIIAKESPWRFITIQNALLNYNRAIDTLETFYRLEGIEIVEGPAGR